MNSNDLITLAQQRLSAARGRDLSKRVELGLGVGSVHIDRALTNVAVQYQNNEYIADAVMPVVRVSKKSDKYFKFKPETMFNIAAVDVVGAESMPGRPAGPPPRAPRTDRALMDFISVDKLNARRSSPIDVTETHQLDARP
jgi:hypothetical protein